MTCEAVRDLLYLVLCNELEVDEASQVYAHLAGCEACRKALSEQARMLGFLEQTMPKVRFPYYSESN